MSNKQNRNTQATPNATPSLEELKAAAEEARKKASEAVMKAGQPDATAEDKDAVAPLEEAAQAAEKARDEAQAKADSEAQAEAARLAEEAKAKAKEELEDGGEQKDEEEEEDPTFVPVLVDESGERIARNSLIRVVTTTGLNLRSLDGELVTPDPVCEVKGPDIRKGDWWTTQFAAGLIAVDSTRKMK